MACLSTPARLRAGIFACVAGLAASLVSGAEAETSVIARGAYGAELGGLTVSFLARDLETGVEHLLEGSDVDTRHAPWSTFKIPNMVIALETGVAPSAEAWRDWDPARRPAASYWPEAWKQGQTLRTAFERSAAWYFQDLALEIGGAAYRERLSAWNYGNASVPDGADDFWLNRSLKVSVREQVDFVSALLTGELDVSAATLAALDDASLAGAAPGLSLHGKTGSGPVERGHFDGGFSGWYAGYLRREGRAPVAFALHVVAPSYGALRAFRKEFSVRLLEDTGLAPRGAFQAR